MRCSNMAADSKTEKKLGQSLTVTRAVLLPKTRLRTTAGRCKVAHFEIVVYVYRGCRGRSSGGRRTSSRSSIGSSLTTVGTLLVFSSSLVMVGRRKQREQRRFTFAAFFRDRRVMGVA